MKHNPIIHALPAVCLSATLSAVFSTSALAQGNNSHDPTWWAKYQYLSSHAKTAAGTTTQSLTVGSNVDVSNECGPQSETYITLNPASPQMLAAGSNEALRDEMRGYFSVDGGQSWGGVDLPLPAPLVSNGTRFGSDPSLAFDSRGNLYYSYIVIFFGGGKGVNGTEVAVAKSVDGGQTYPQVSYFSFTSGENHFNDKPIITADTAASSPFRDNVYVAWDAANGGSAGGGIRVGRSSDGGQTFLVNRADDPSGPGKGFGAVPFTGPNGEVYVAWDDYHANAMMCNRSLDGGATWGQPVTIASKTLPSGMAIPAESSRGALQYPAADSDRSSGPFRGRLYCSWMDLTPDGTTDIFFSFSTDRGATWSQPVTIADQLPFLVDRFSQWLSVDPVTGDVNVSFYDTRNDATGARYSTDIYLTRSTDGGQTWLSPNVRVSTQSSNEHDCNGLYPCPAIDYGNQQGDYNGLTAYGGVAYPIWTDSRLNQTPAAGCPSALTMEEVFTASVK